MSAAYRCRYCGKPTPKRTVTHWFGRDNEGHPSDYWISHKERPRSKSEVQRLVNGQIVSVRWSRGEEYGAKQAGFDFITRASVWDGESYADKFFCNGDHAKRFGYAMARIGDYGTRDYYEALALKSEQPK